MKIDMCEFVNALKEKDVINVRCKCCGEYNACLHPNVFVKQPEIFSTTDQASFYEFAKQSWSQCDAQVAPSIVYVVISCQNCGFIREHDIKALGFEWGVDNDEWKWRLKEEENEEKS